LGIPMTITEAAEHLKNAITANSQWGSELTPYHLHELIRMRHFWPSKIDQTEIIVFAAMLHRYVLEGDITAGDLREILLTSYLEVNDVEKLCNPGFVYELMKRVYAAHAPEVAKATSKQNRKSERKQQKKSRRANRA